MKFKLLLVVIKEFLINLTVKLKTYMYFASSS